MPERRLSRLSVMTAPSRGLVAAAAVIAAALAARCASAPPAPDPSRAGFPIDPRVELEGPFDEPVERGWRALQAGDARTAARDFADAPAKRGPSARAAAIGSVEALVAMDHADEALERCRALLGDGDPTTALLTACGEAHAKAGQPADAYELYARAASRSPRMTRVAGRAAELREAAVARMLDEAEADAAAGRRADARAKTARALASAPRSATLLVRAGDVACALGDRETALADYREALEAGELDPETRARIAAVALESGDPGLAVTIYERLSADDPRFRERAAEARLEFRISNWPDAERAAARARRLTRAGAASLVWWTFPEVREARVTTGVVATDLLERRDSRAMMRAVSLGLLEVDPDTHRARPDAVLTRPAAARLLVRLAGTVGSPKARPECLKLPGIAHAAGADAIRVAARCELLSESGSSAVGGAEFTRGLDRLRSLFPAGEVAGRD
jgi:tetratricopeptide (TPR) repeat protein